MSLQAMAWAIEYQDLPVDGRTGIISSSCKLVLLALANHADRDGRDCFPSVETIRCYTGLSERGVQYALRALEEHGTIRQTADPLVRASTIKDGRTRPTSYDIVPPIGGANSRASRSDRGANSKIESPDQGCKVFDEFAPEPVLEPSKSKSEPKSKPSSRASRSASSPNPSGDLFGATEPAEQADEVGGSRGEQDQGRHGGDPLPTVTARDVTAAWVDAYRATGVEPTRSLIGQASRTAKELLTAGNDPQRVIAAATTAGSKGYATIAREMTGTNGHRGVRASTTDKVVSEVRSAFREYRQSGGQLGLPGGSQ